MQSACRLTASCRARSDTCSSALLGERRMTCAATSPASVIRRRAGESQDVLSPRSSGIPARRLYRHQPGSSGRARCRLLQSARHSEQSIKEGKGAIKWTRLSCRTFAANAVRLQLHALAYNLGNFMRTLAMPKAAEPWSLTSLREKLIKLGAKVVSHGGTSRSRWPRSRCRVRCSTKSCR